MTDEMRTSDFWVKRQADPDQVILSSEEIKNFNQQTVQGKLTKDLSMFASQVTSQEVKDQLEKNLTNFYGKEFYLKSNEKIGAEYLNRLASNLNLNGLPDKIVSQYGFIISYADQRFFPTEEGLYVKLGDFDFDEVQNSALNNGTPVVILHESLDHQWFYVQAADLDGWVEKSKIALCSKESWNAYQYDESSLTVISAKAKIFKDENLTQGIETVQMGSRFKRNRAYAPGAYGIYLLQRDQEGKLTVQTGYIKEEDALTGFLPYTQKNIFTQAFKLLDRPYGWGGMNGEQDCSRFLQEVYATVGINLPRNSSEQAQVGKLMAAFDDNISDLEKLNILKEKAVAGMTLLKLKGHIMLYLGMVDGRPYAIHATWGFRKPNVSGEDEVCVLNRVVVSDLSLGEGSKKGSLLKRVNAVTLIGRLK